MPGLGYFPVLPALPVPAQRGAARRALRRTVRQDTPPLRIAAPRIRARLSVCSSSRAQVLVQGAPPCAPDDSVPHARPRPKRRMRCACGPRLPIRAGRTCGRTARETGRRAVAPNAPNGRAARVNFRYIYRLPTLPEIVKNLQNTHRRRPVKKYVRTMKKTVRKICFCPDLFVTFVRALKLVNHFGKPDWSAKIPVSAVAKSHRTN